MANESNKAVGGVFAIVALITGIAAIVRPMQLSMDSFKAAMDRRLVHVEEHAKEDGHPYAMFQRVMQVSDRLEDHEKLLGHSDVREQLSGISVQFKEVETQFDNLDERTHRIEKRFENAINDLKEDINKEFAYIREVLEVKIENPSLTTIG